MSSRLPARIEWEGMRGAPHTHPPPSPPPPHPFCLLRGHFALSLYGTKPLSLSLPRPLSLSFHPFCRGRNTISFTTCKPSLLLSSERRPFRFIRRGREGAEGHRGAIQSIKHLLVFTLVSPHFAPSEIISQQHRFNRNGNRGAPFKVNKCQTVDPLWSIRHCTTLSGIEN